jgi:hypothetical protein
MAEASDLRPTAQEVEEYHKWVWDTLGPLLHQVIQEKKPLLLWHYTTGDNLIKIIQSGELWTTQVSCVNDSTEVSHAATQLKNALSRRPEATDKTHRAYELCRRSDEELTPDQAADSFWYVGSLSGAGNDLSQWRAYASGEGGYALGFDPQMLNQKVLSRNGQLWLVIYDTAIQENLGEQFAAKTIEFYLKGLDARPGVASKDFVVPFLQEWVMAVTAASPLLKHKDFRGEDEYRIVRKVFVDEAKKMRFVQKRFMISRHYPIKLHDDPKPGEELSVVMPSLRLVVVGPSPMKLRSQISAAYLLRSAGYQLGQGVDVMYSQTPFQSP